MVSEMKILCERKWQPRVDNTQIALGQSVSVYRKKHKPGPREKTYEEFKNSSSQKYDYSYQSVDSPNLYKKEFEGKIIDIHPRFIVIEVSGKTKVRNTVSSVDIYTKDAKVILSEL